MEKLNNVKITLGNDTEIDLNVVDISTAISGTLVPEGWAYFEGEVEEVTFEYKVSLTKELIQSMKLVVSAQNITIDGKTDYAHLVEVTIADEVGEKELDIFNTEVTVTVTVRLLEPIDEAEALEKGLVANVEDSQATYEAIRGKEIALTLRFKLQPNN